jgi:glyoxylase-like metal-dependent hydrolase (beta-lactamase superfamily II)
MFKVVWLSAIPGVLAAQDARTVLNNAVKAMGSENLRTIQFSGMGSFAGIGQNVNPKAGWPMARMKSYQRELDFASGLSHVQMVRVQEGAGDQTVNQFTSPDSPWDSQFEFWLTPYGFLKGAIANNAAMNVEIVGGVKQNVVTFSVRNKYKVAGYINETNLVEEVRTWIDNDVLADMPTEAWYSEYKDFGGVKFPTMIVEKQGDFPVLIVSVADVKPNASVTISAPSVPTAAATPPPMVLSEKVADGVYYLRGGTHHSVAIAFSDYVTVVEAPLNEQRSLAVIEEVKKLIPNKPIRYVVNTHHHFDHSGGLRAYVNEGATIITQDINTDFFEKAFAAPRTLNPDGLSKSGKKAIFQTVGDKKVLSDGSRTLELHLIKNSPHDDGILMAFLPKEKILIEVDVYTPATPVAAGAAPASAPAVSPAALNLIDNLERLKLDFETILPLHGSGAVSRPDLYAAVRKPAPPISVILSAEPSSTGGGGRGGQRAVAAAPTPGQVKADGKQILENACTTCHTLARVQNLKLTKPEWQGMVDRMKGRGAEVTDEDVAILVDYLTKTYGLP